jgi:hypothetical protein
MEKTITLIYNINSKLWMTLPNKSIVNDGGQGSDLITFGGLIRHSSSEIIKII